MERFVERALSDPSIAPKVLRRMGVQLPGQSGWIVAEQASLHRIEGSRMTWLSVTLGFWMFLAVSGILPIWSSNVAFLMKRLLEYEFFLGASSF